VAPALWHSDLTSAQRRATWRAVALGRAPVVVGARSALFLPYPDLGLIVVDEEHESAFKQEDGVTYHARDMAVVRAQLGGIPAVLVSATPSLETLNNVRGGRYRALHLPERHGDAALPSIALVDLRQDRPAKLEGLGPGWLSDTLRKAIGETLAAGEQVLLFLNRRGYAPLTLCRACGHRLQCPNCTAWLVEHRLAGRLQCHHCGYAARLPSSCPDCGAEGSLTACGPGVERLAEEARVLFPQARQATMTSDTLTGPESAAALVQAVQARDIDLLIGTQIVAKGHHFPHLTLVGVVDADLGLYCGDLRAAERTYQLLHQVAGRAGRAEHPGRVLLQTAEPDHPVMEALAAGDRDRFFAAEAAAREGAGLPPFGRLAALVLSGHDARQLDEVCRVLARAAPRVEGVTVLGPAPAPLAVLRGRHRRRFLVKAPRGFRLQPLLRAWLGQAKIPSAIRLQVDVDPYSFL
jgi:primosomal protein N' (replication factor Y) (superfamily II helicase)